MIICRRCGLSNEIGARFCNRCGDYIEHVPPSAPSASTPAPTDLPQPASASSDQDQPPARKPEIGPVGRGKPAPVPPPSPPPAPRVQTAEPVAASVPSPATGGTTPETVFCSGCGAANPADRVFCLRCGTELSALEAAGYAPVWSAARSVAPTSGLLERLRSEDAERLVPLFVTASLMASLLALIAASVVLLTGGGAPVGSLAAGSSPPSAAPSSIAAASFSPVPSADPGNGGSSASGGGSPGQPGVVGIEGIDAWDALDAAEKTRVTTVQSLFLHQSVGGDLEDGAQAVGFRFGYADSSSTNLDVGLNGGTFFSSNGDPSGKIAEFQSMALANRATVTVAIMKFGYADIVEGTVADVQTAYQAAVSDIKAQGIRVLHVTPPFVYDAPAENAPKMQMRAWMMVTFPDDVIFDLQDVESLDPTTGTRCEREGSWEICDSVRSTVGCQSQNQGIDSAQGQGHICFDPHAQSFAKAFLYAIYLAGR